MIRTETEYREALERLAAEEVRVEDMRKHLKARGLKKSETKRVLDPLLSFHSQLREEVDAYERLKRGEFEELHNFEGIGRMLIALRIAKGLTQRELAERIDVHESQVSRDERNEYCGITVERAKRILEALGADVRSVVAASS